MNRRPDPERIDNDAPEWTEDTFRRAKPAREVLPELFGAQADEMLAPGSGRPEASQCREPVNLCLDPDIVAAFRATGPGWQSRMNKALADWLTQHDPGELTRR